MKIRTAIDIDKEGRSWPLLQFGPVADEVEARAMLETLQEFFAERFNVPGPPVH